MANTLSHHELMLVTIALTLVGEELVDTLIPRSLQPDSITRVLKNRRGIWIPSPFLFFRELIAVDGRGSTNKAFRILEAFNQYLLVEMKSGVSGYVSFGSVLLLGHYS